MTTDETTPQRRTPYFLIGCLAAFIGVPLLLAVGAVVFWMVWAHRSAAAVDEELARIRAAGEPASAEELHKYYAAPPQGEDCTDLWLRGIDGLDSEEFGTAYDAVLWEDPNHDPEEFADRIIPRPGEPWPEREAAERLLGEHADALKLMHEAADRGGAARYPVAFEDGLAALLPHDHKLRGGARLLSLEAYVRGHQGDPTGAARSIHAIFAAGESLRNEPVVISHLVRIGVGGVGGETLDNLVGAVDFSDEDLEGFQTMLSAIDYQEGHRRALVGERATGITVFRDPASAVEDMGSEKPPIPMGPRNDDLLLYLQFIDKSIAAADHPFPRCLKKAKENGEEVTAFFDDASAITKARYIMTALMIPALNAVTTATARGTALNRCATAGAAAERYRQRHGTLPERLDQLVGEFLPNVPEDPFDGEPLRYKVTDGEAVIYSIGPNEQDDGGRRMLEDETEGDVVFRLEKR